jgi:PIN domain nuclease of toxin-antitoxin system
MEAARSVHAPPCRLHEIALKVREGRWPEMARHAPTLDRLCATNGFEIAPCTAGMALLAGALDRDHLDPFDRMIGATALGMGMALVSSGGAFDGLAGRAGWKGRVRAGSGPGRGRAPGGRCPIAIWRGGGPLRGICWPRPGLVSGAFTAEPDRLR